MTSARALFLSSLLLLLSCDVFRSPTEPRSDPSTGSAVLTVRIIEDLTGQPISGATVTVTQGAAFSAKTGEDGMATLDPLSAGVARVDIETAGMRKSGVIRLFSGTGQRQFAVTTCPPRLYGLVRDSRSGEPVAGAVVRLFGYESITRADGYYEFVFECGSYPGSTVVFEVSHQRYETYSEMTRMSYFYGLQFYDAVLSRK